MGGVAFRGGLRFFWRKGEEGGGGRGYKRGRGIFLVLVFVVM